MRPMPQSLKIVACLFIVLGVSYVADMLIGLFQSTVRLDAGVIALPIGYGLLRLRPRALPWALLCTWVGLAGSLVGVLVLPFVPLHVHFQVFGATVGEIPRGLAAALCAAFFALSFWQYRVLTAAPVRRLFDPRVSPGGA